jgi:cobalt-zinc-cadmium efflux system outer membrane protein
MKKRSWVLPGILAAALACASPALAQATSPIRQGFDAAWARQPEQAGAALRKQAAAASLEAARRWTPEPASLELTARSDRFTRNDGGREYDAAVAVPLWLPGERSRAQAAASAESSAVDARLRASRWRLAGEVREAYWAQQRAHVEHALAAQRLANAKQLASDVARRVHAGDLARADAHQAESAVAAAESVVAEAVVALTQAAQVWSSLTGSLSAIGPPEPRPADATTDDHPALVELRSEGEVARRQRDLADVQTRANPELTVGAARERDGFGERYGHRVVIGVRVPLGRSSASRSKAATANAERVETESLLERETQRVRAQAEAARIKVGVLERSRAAAERRAALARESRGFFEKSFRLGESDLPTRLRIEMEAFEAERQAARSRLEVDAAVSHLRQALGLLPD